LPVLYRDLEAAGIVRERRALDAWRKERFDPADCA
jgi:hypothetical protein